MFPLGNVKVFSSLEPEIPAEKQKYIIKSNVTSQARP